MNKDLQQLNPLPIIFDKESHRYIWKPTGEVFTHSVTGITGFNMELGSAYSEELTKAGYDLSDADQVVAGLKNQEVVDKATERGVKRGIPIAVANFVGARVAGSMVNPLATTGRQVAQQFGKGMWYSV
jgi:hypothetical protein